MNADADLRAAVARLIEAKITGTRGFVARTGARAFLRLYRSTSRIGQGLATVGPVSGGFRFSTPDRVVVIERGAMGYRVLVRSFVGGFPIVFYDRWHEDLDTVAPALIDVLPVMRSAR